ncbi:MAG: hypothetical protein NC131_19810 [Roseburia sp.]|nr:hypothetical protein [Roseburia sp.]
MKALRILILSLTAILAASATAQSADDILRATAAKIAQSPSVEVQFTITAGAEPVEGSAVLAGGYFTLSTPMLRVWFDGLTQWTMLTQTGEVSITEPTPDELMESNPFAILRNYGNRYRARRLSDVSGRKRVELTPLAGTDTDIERAILLVNGQGWPAAAEVHYKGNRTVAAAVDHISAGGAKPQSAFRFDPARYPASEIIDLR